MRKGGRDEEGSVKKCGNREGGRCKKMWKQGVTGRKNETKEGKRQAVGEGRRKRTMAKEERKKTGNSEHNMRDEGRGKREKA